MLFKSDEFIMNRFEQHSLSFEANTICQHFVYFKTSSQRILLSNPGTWIDQKLFTKIEKIKDKIEVMTVTDHELVHSFTSLLQNHVKCELENEWLHSKEEILVLFNRMLVEGKAFLNWSIACYEVFNRVESNVLNELHETDVNLFRKSHFSAAVAIWLSLANGLYDSDFLEDIYHIAFFQDAGLIDSSYSYYIAEALDQESLSPGQGIKYLLNQKASEAEIKLYIDHPFASYEFIKRLDLLNNSDLANTVLLGHELSNGEGFPFGYTEAVLANWERIIILADHLVKYNSSVDFNLFKELEIIRSLKLTVLPVKKVFARALATVPCIHHEVSA